MSGVVISTHPWPLCQSLSSQCATRNNQVIASNNTGQHSIEQRCIKVAHLPPFFFFGTTLKKESSFVFGLL